MKKLFIFCLLTTFALATSVLARPRFKESNECIDYKLKSCPAHAICDTCTDTINGPEFFSPRGNFYPKQYKITSCENGYTLENNECIKIEEFNNSLENQNN